MSLGLSVFTEFGPCEHLASLQMFHRRLYILSWMVNVLSFPLPPPQRGSGISDESSSLTQTADESLRTIWFTASLELTSISLSPPSLLLSFLSYALCFAHYSHSDSWIQIMSRIVYIVWVFLASIQRLALDSFLFFFPASSVLFAGGKTATGLEYFTSTLLCYPCLLKSRPSQIHSSCLFNSPDHL